MPQAASPQMARIRKVYLTGTNTKWVKYAQKHLAHDTCAEPVESVQEADAILDFERDDTTTPPPQIEREYDPNPTVTCRAGSSTVSCSDSNGITERVTCSSNAYSDVTCRASYFDVSGAVIDAANAALDLLVCHAVGS